MSSPVFPVWKVEGRNRTHVGEAQLTGGYLTLKLEDIPELKGEAKITLPYWVRDAQQKRRPWTPWERESLKRLEEELRRDNAQRLAARQPASSTRGEEGLTGVVHLQVPLPPGAGLNMDRLARGASETSLIAVATDSRCVGHLWIEGRPDVRQSRVLHILVDATPDHGTIVIRPATEQDRVSPRLAPRPETLPDVVLERQATAELNS